MYARLSGMRIIKKIENWKGSGQLILAILSLKRKGAQSTIIVRYIFCTIVFDHGLFLLILTLKYIVKTGL
ncbi:hypothetical protein GV64_10510 [Endozoicomonas elysicola]|uniref:Uncharacterized protein n=1 Tax=Endozoicomonas elysicola TaxID=305900 RepID=A0A081KAE5_9GAMM|nr:hypothetical protein GV64_10510 [Endozoicomonas elysicola]